MFANWSPGEVICLVFVAGLAITGIIRAIRGTRPYEKPDDDDDFS